MSRPRKPTAVLEASGAFRKNPDRKREGEPEVKDPVGVCPDSFSDLERQCWRQIVEQAPPGVLTLSETVQVEFAAQLLAEYREDRRGFAVSKLNTLIKVLASFGMNPSDRSRLNIKPAERENRFSRFAGGG